MARIIFADANTAVVEQWSRTGIYTCPENPILEERTWGHPPENWREITDAREARSLGLEVEIPQPVYKKVWADLKTARAEAGRLAKQRIFKYNISGGWEYPGLGQMFPEIGPVQADDSRFVFLALATGNHRGEWPLPEEAENDSSRQALRARVPVTYHEALDRLQRRFRKTIATEEASKKAARRKELAQKFGLSAFTAEGVSRRKKCGTVS